MPILENKDKVLIFKKWHEMYSFWTIKSPSLAYRVDVLTLSGLGRNPSELTTNRKKSTDFEINVHLSLIKVIPASLKIIIPALK